MERDKESGLLGLGRIAPELSGLLEDRPVDLRTPQDLSRYFRDDVVRLAEAQYEASDPAMAFKRKFGAFARQTRRERIPKSADHDDWRRAAARRGHRTADASSVVADAVARAVMDPEHAALDDLLK